jgi:hypothetical protein
MSSCSPALGFLAELNEEVKRRGLGRVVIVGGFAVELYSGGAYRTGDIDFVIDTPRVKEAQRVFEELTTKRGWRKVSRVYEGPGALYLDLVGYTYTGRVKELHICGGSVYVQSPEDAIVSSLNACVYWESPADCERAAAVLSAQREHIDWGYLLELARRNGVDKKLEEIKHVVEKTFSALQDVVGERS